MFSLTRKYNDDLDLFSDVFDDVFKLEQTKLENFGDKTTISLVAPKMSKEDFKISIKDYVLSIAYDVSSKNNSFVTQKKFFKSWNLRDRVADIGKISATYEQGVLIVTIPHLNVPEQTEMQIEVK